MARIYLGDAAVDPSPSAVSEWFSTATNFRQKYAEYRTNVDALSRSTVDSKKYPDIAQARTDLLNRAASIDSKTKGIIDGIETAYNSVKNFLSNAYAPIEQGSETFGKELYNAVDWVKTATGLNGLGFLPLLIPVAIIAASLATIGYWINDAYKLNKRVAMLKDAEAKGMTPAQATALVNQQMGAINSGGILDFLSNIKGVVMWAGLGTAVFIGYKIYTEMKGKKNV